jgi:hypothetical protein
MNLTLYQFLNLEQDDLMMSLTQKQIVSSRVHEKMTNLKKKRKEIRKRNKVPFCDVKIRNISK